LKEFLESENVGNERALQKEEATFVSVTEVEVTNEKSEKS